MSYVSKQRQHCNTYAANPKMCGILIAIKYSNIHLPRESGKPSLIESNCGGVAQTGSALFLVAARVLLLLLLATFVDGGIMCGNFWQYICIRHIRYTAHFG